jgi:hypothetical protein
MNVTHWDDVSHFQGAFKPTRAVIAKATQGTGFTDNQFAGIMTRAAAGGHHAGAYHFMQAGSVAAQAKFAHSVIGSRPAMLDVEKYTLDGGKTWHWPTLSECVGFIKDYRALGGVMNVSYIPHWFWADNWHAASLSPLTALGIRNINSDYSKGSADRSASFAAFGGLPNLGLQYTSTPHDMNVANMTWDQVWAIFSGKPVAKQSPANGSRQLQQGMQGPDVKFVQQKIGAAHAGLSDSDFGPTTKAGVEWWQKQHKLKSADGIVGRETWPTFGVKATF